VKRQLHRKVAHELRRFLEDGGRVSPEKASDAFIHVIMEAASRAAGVSVDTWAAGNSLQPSFPDVYPAGFRDEALYLLSGIPAQDWRLDLQLPGWLYQYWLTPEKDRLFRMFKGGAKASQGDIPAVTQLFTPEWIARYLAENTLGRLWTQLYPDTGLIGLWTYYDRSADIAESSGVTDGLEEWSVLDPACGCGHLLAAAFDVLLDMHLEAGIEPIQAVRMILNRQLFGLDIDPKAVDMCRFILLQKAAAVAPSIVHEEVEWGIEAITRDKGYRFGSLDKGEPKAVSSGEDGTSSAADHYRLLNRKYHAVITNPPYLGRRNMDKELGDFLDQSYPRTSADLFAAFLERCLEFLYPFGYFGAITPQSWMFLSGFEELRTGILTRETLVSLLHLGARAFADNNGQVVQTVSFVLHNTPPSPNAAGSFWKLTEGPSSHKEELYKRNNCGKTASFKVHQAMFRQIPGMRMAYQLPEEWALLFRRFPPLDRYYAVKKGMDTGCNERYVRLWHEVPQEQLSFRCADPSLAHWFPYAKGGGPQKWYGNHYFVVFWRNNGEAIRKDSRSNLRNYAYFGRQGITWSTVSTGKPGFRLLERGFLFDNGGSCLFPEEGREETLPALLAYLNSEFTAVLLSQMNPTLNIQPGDVARLPLDEALLHDPRMTELGEACLRFAKAEWDESERSWDYAGHPAAHSCREDTVEASLRRSWELRCRRTAETQKLEQAINRLVYGHYGLKPLSGYSDREHEETEQPDLKETAESFLAYAAGCILGTYSMLTTEDPAFTGFPLIRDSEWVTRLKLWLGRIWSPWDTDSNVEVIARYLGIRSKESVEQRLRRYFSREWYPAHCRQFGGYPRYLRICSGPRQALLAYVSALRLTEELVDEVYSLCVRRREELLGAIHEAGEWRLDMEELDGFARRLEEYLDPYRASRGNLSQEEGDTRAMMEQYRALFDC
jgi:hypothetical protein